MSHTALYVGTVTLSREKRCCPSYPCLTGYLGLGLYDKSQIDLKQIPQRGSVTH